MSEPPAETVDRYAGYARWKHCDGALAVSVRDPRYFAAEFREIPLRGKRVLEIGFGNRSFLAWAKAEGAQISGLEINPQMLAAAARHGYTARNAAVADLVAEGARYARSRGCMGRIACLWTRTSPRFCASDPTSRMAGQRMMRHHRDVLPMRR